MVKIDTVTDGAYGAESKIVGLDGQSLMVVKTSRRQEWSVL
jgi:hypothetical protein